MGATPSVRSSRSARSRPAPHSEKSPELRQLARQDERVRKILELGTRIEGLARHASVHAAGVVIAPGPLTDYVPVCLAPQEAEAIITQYDMVALEQVGMLKIDVLGLRTLTVIHDAVRMVADRHGVTLDMNALDLEDPQVYQLLGSAGSPCATRTPRWRRSSSPRTV